MACTRKRRGSYVVDWRDGAGVRHWKSFDRKVDADTFRDDVSPLARQRTTSTIPVNITVAGYAALWMEKCQATTKRSTSIRYQELLDLHILPALGQVKLRDLSRLRIKDFLLTKLRERKQTSSPDHKGLLSVPKFVRKTVGNIHATLRSMLQSALSDGAVRENPARELGKELHLIESKKARRSKIKAMDKQQRDLFLATAYREAPRYYPLFFTLAGVGARLGEILALQWDDLKLHKREIEIERSLSEHAEGDETDTPKSGYGRTVDLSQALTDTLARHKVACNSNTLKLGHPLPRWVFHTQTGTVLDAPNVRRIMRSILKHAKLPLHFTPHCLRHTYASLMLQQGESLKYVQKQLGHGSIELTADTYGDWLPMGNKAAVDRLDSGTEYQVNYVASSERGSKVVAGSGYPRNPQRGTNLQLPEIPWNAMEPATRIERATCGLRNRCSTN